MPFFLLGKGPDGQLRLLTDETVPTRQEALTQLSEITASPDFNGWDDEVYAVDVDNATPVLLVRPAVAEATSAEDEQAAETVDPADEDETEAPNDAAEEVVAVPLTFVAPDVEEPASEQEAELSPNEVSEPADDAPELESEPESDPELEATPEVALADDQPELEAGPPEAEKVEDSDGASTIEEESSSEPVLAEDAEIEELAEAQTGEEPALEADVSIEADELVAEDLESDESEALSPLAEIEVEEPVDELESVPPAEGPELGLEAGAEVNDAASTDEIAGTEDRPGPDEVSELVADLELDAELEALESGGDVSTPESTEAPSDAGVPELPDEDAGVPAEAEDADESEVEIVEPAASSPIEASNEPDSDAEPELDEPTWPWTTLVVDEEATVSDSVDSEPEAALPEPEPEPVPAGYQASDNEVADLTCDDCVYTDTCPNKDQREPSSCGSFQWK